MCQIFFCLDSTPSIEQLETANKLNPHGIGFAWPEGGRVHWSKGYEDKEIQKAIDLFLEKPFPKAIHFRLATHGGKTMDMTHPFNITKLSAPSLHGVSNGVLFHNGVWTDYRSLLTSGIVAGTLSKKVLNTPISDSRAMAILAGSYGESFLDLCDLTGEKVLVLKPNGNYITYGHWYEEEDGAWFHSNSRLNEEIVVRTKTVPHKASVQGYIPGYYLGSDFDGAQAHWREWEGDAHGD